MYRWFDANIYYHTSTTIDNKIMNKNSNHLKILDAYIHWPLASSKTIWLVWHFGLRISIDTEPIRPKETSREPHGHTNLSIHHAHRKYEFESIDCHTYSLSGGPIKWSGPCPSGPTVNTISIFNSHSFLHFFISIIPCFVFVLSLRLAFIIALVASWSHLLSANNKTKQKKTPPM